MANVTEAALRAEAHPDYARLVDRKSSLAADVTSLEARLAAAKAEAALRWGAALRALLAAIISFVLLVWLLGVAVEGAWLVVRMAGDVRRIREATVEPTAPAADSGPAAAADRLPVGDNAAGGALPATT